MNPAELHLALNHIVVVGVPIGLLLLLAGMFFKSPDLKRAALWVFVLGALITIPVFLTGKAGEEVVENLPDVQEEQIAPHESMGLYSLIGAELLGVMALATLISLGSKSGLSGGLVLLSTLLSLAISGMLLWTAYLGGQINHPELRSDYQSVQQQDDDD